MSDTANSRPPRNGGADTTSEAAPGSLRNWLRQILRGRSNGRLREAIEELIEEPAEPDATMASHERMLLANILKLRDLSAYDVMVPRADIVAIDVETEMGEALRVLAARTHSRVPVYRDSLDDIVGMVHIKDLMPYMAARLAETGAETSRERQLRDFVRDVLIIAPSMSVLDLLLEMREKRQHLALVVDEFGGIDGLVTIEDLVEEIVGEIEDEHEADEAPRLIERPDGSVIADARLPIEEFEARFGPILSDDEREDIDTLGGLVYAIAGRIPARGELLRHPSGLEFEIVDADPRRIRRLRVRRVGTDTGTDG